MALRQAGVEDVRIAPLTRIAYLGFSPPPETIVFTSSNAVESWRRAGHPAADRMAFCVGPRTTAAARRLGFRIAGTARDAAGVFDLLIQSDGPFVHLRGETERGDLCGRLTSLGRDARAITVYQADALTLPAAIRAMISEGGLVLPVYSPRSAQLLGNECGAAALSRSGLVAISEATAAVLPGEAVRIAARPDGEAMIEAILEELSN